MKKIFVSGPYTKGDVAINVKNAIDISNSLIDMGFAPFCPHLTHFLHMHKPQEYEKWLAIDVEFLKLCDAVLRIPGESNGADLEVGLALNLNIPVYYNLEDVLNEMS